MANKKNNASYVELIIHEGKNHQVKKMFEAIGYKVEKLKREKYAFLDVKNLKSGEYRKLTTNEIVYVGQTVNLQFRRIQHEKYDPFNPNTKEYNYPLSRGIRKYGVENYECIILEEVNSESELNDREKY